MLLHKTRAQVPLLDTLHCGQLLELVSERDYNHDLSITFLENVETKAHIHTGNDEIYICLEGELNVQTLTPGENIIRHHTLKQYESLNIPKNTHHKVIKSAEPNKLLTICIPAWRPEWEIASDKL